MERQQEGKLIHKKQIKVKPIYVKISVKINENYYMYKFNLTNFYKKVTWLPLIVNKTPKLLSYMFPQ